jgi:hypothetical protein
VVIDNSGAVWVGTNKGLASFNGSEWRTFSPMDSGLADGSPVLRLCHAPALAADLLASGKRRGQDNPKGGMRTILPVTAICLLFKNE